MTGSCFDGYLTPECETCDFWRDGSGDSIGCAYPGPIDHCEAFAKVMRENEMKNELDKKFVDLEKSNDSNIKTFLSKTPEHLNNF